ncbi:MULTISPECIES: polyamine aminopropyltransferase [Niastella]|uniref:Polyamine aminopropyltransferase n=1 Tax=Niastella soli TaxID=2821487 RepID=A0ABS3YSN1_9BACT|nr:polyamine aminopropyltransferase [Niastella soli]MBO9200902.1 polyamine aminopropyltransferase [Niastella soli]
MQLLLLLAVFVIATCGLIYELVAGTLASYLLGDSVTQFSTIIGVYLFSMGVGAFLSRYFNKNLLRWFIQIELLVGMIGGFSAPLLFILFPIASSFRLVLYALVFFTGTLVGLEIPLLMRILQDKVEFKELVSRVFTFDYIGALLAALIFPLLLVPQLGLIRTSLFFGILNIGVGLFLAIQFGKEVRRAGVIKGMAILLLLIELVAFVFSERIMNYSETLTYNDHVIFATSSPYQRIVLTKNKREMRLFLNGNLQFSSADEYRYHEALIHPGLQAVQQPQKVLVLGGGDGLAVREILKYPSITSITLVDLDKKMTQLFSTNHLLTQLNKGSLNNAKVKVLSEDAFLFLKSNTNKFDFIVIDFPDPSNFSIGKLYSNSFYRLLYQALADGGVAVIQSTSPYVAPKSFWCIDETIRSVGFHTAPYHNLVPSFGEWGYILAFKNNSYKIPANYLPGLRFLNPATAQQMFVFPQDMRTTQPLAVNKLNNQVLVNYFEEEWNAYLE